LDNRPSRFLPLFPLSAANWVGKLPRMHRRNRETVPTCVSQLRLHPRPRVPETPGNIWCLDALKMQRTAKNAKTRPWKNFFQDWGGFDAPAPAPKRTRFLARRVGWVPLWKKVKAVRRSFPVPGGITPGEGRNRKNFWRSPPGENRNNSIPIWGVQHGWFFSFGSGPNPLISGRNVLGGKNRSAQSGGRLQQHGPFYAGARGWLGSEDGLVWESRRRARYRVLDQAPIRNGKAGPRGGLNKSNFSCGNEKTHPARFVPPAFPDGFPPCKGLIARAKINLESSFRRQPFNTSVPAGGSAKNTGRSRKNRPCGVLRHWVRRFPPNRRDPAVAWSKA